MPLYFVLLLCQLLAGLKLIDLEYVKRLEMAEVFSFGFTGIKVRLLYGLLVDELLQFARFVQIHFFKQL
jgi:hypothetical protein